MVVEERRAALLEYGFLKDLSVCFMRPDLRLAEGLRSQKLAEEVDRIRQGYDIFVRNHLLKWFDAFAADVKKHDDMGFYGALVTIAQATLIAAAKDN